MTTPSSSASGSGPGNRGAPLAVETSCRRVTVDDIQQVSQADVERTLATMTPEQFRAALRVLADHNKVGMTLATADEGALAAALQGVNAGMVRDARAKTQASPAMQALLLAQTTEGMRLGAVDAIRRMQEAGDLF